MAKPKIYELASKAAAANLEVKINILADFVTNGIPWVVDNTGMPVRNPENGHRLLDFFPLNDLQFSRWSCEYDSGRAISNCEWIRNDLVARFGFFRGHGVDSLKKRPADHMRVRSLFNALSIIAKRQCDAEDPGSRICELKAEVDRLMASCTAMAALVHRSLEEKEEHLIEIENLKRALASARQIQAESEAAGRLELQRKDDQIATLRRELNTKPRLVLR